MLNDIANLPVVGRTGPLLLLILTGARTFGSILFGILV